MTIQPLQILERRKLVLVLVLARSQTNLRASRLSMFQLQAEHQHAAELIDLLFKGRLICFYSCFATQADC